MRFIGSVQKHATFSKAWSRKYSLLAQAWKHHHVSLTEFEGLRQDRLEYGHKARGYL